MYAEKIKRIPYGISDFEKIIKTNRYFVDKTRFISILEEYEYIFFIRPRRFGKSLWLNILESYYDINKKEMFDILFGGTYAGKHPTDIKNSFKILKFDFSLVTPDPAKLEESFESYCNIVIKDFIKKYRQYYREDFVQYIESLTTFSEKLTAIFMENREHETKIYVLIDEYDNFTNTLISTSGSLAYKNLTHGKGFFRHFFAVLKGGITQSGSGLDRLFITGVSPITLDDVTSGFNVGNNISLLHTFNEMLGFTEEEITKMLLYYKDAGVLKYDIEKSLDIMRVWYDGYIFSKKSSKPLFNTDMALYFIYRMIIEGGLPDRLIDHNVKIDYEKLRHLIVVSKKLNGNFDSLKQIIEKERIVSDVAESFSLEKLTSSENFVSLLYYFGLLTFRGDQKIRANLSIPNLAVKHLLYLYIREAYNEVDIFNANIAVFSDLIEDMGVEGRWQPFFKFISQEIKKQTSIRDYLKGEKIIQCFILAYLTISDIFIPHTEYETGKGYCDFFLEPFTIKYPDIKYGYIIELKYIKRSTKLTDNIIEKAVQEAEDQLKNYAKDSKISTYIEKLVLVYHGWELIDMRAV